MFDSGIETVKETVLSLKEKVTGIDFDAIKDKVVSLKNTVSNIDFNLVKEDISSLKSNALSIAASDFKNKPVLFKDSLDLLTDATNTLRKITNQMSSISEISNKSLDLLDSLFEAAKDIVNIAYSKGGVEITKSATELAAKAALIVDKSIILANKDNTISEAVYHSINNSLQNIQKTAINIATHSHNEDKAEIAKASFELLSQVSDVISNALKNSGDIGIESQLLADINQFSHSILNTAKTVTDIATMDMNDKTSIAKNSISLIANVNDVISDILVMTDKDTELLNAIHNVTAKNLQNIEESAVNLANADVLSQEGKVSIAINSLTLISQTNKIVAQVLNEANLSTSKTQFVGELTDVLLNTAKSITLLATGNNATTAGKEQLAVASTNLIGNVNDLIQSITSFKGKEDIGNALHSAVDGQLSQIKQLAVALANSDLDSSQGKTAIAITSFGLIAQANNIINQFLDNMSLSTNVSKSVHSLTNSALDAAKILTNVVQVDANNNQGKVVIANSSLELSKTASDIVSTVLKSTSISTQHIDIIHNAVNKTLTEMKDSAVAIALASSENNSAEIATHSLSLLSDASNMLKDIMQGMSPNNVIAPKTLELFNSLFATAQNIVQLADAKSSENIAKASVDLVQSATIILNNVLTLANVDSSLSKAFHQSFDASVSQIKEVAAQLATASSASNKAEIAKLSFDFISQVSDLATNTLTTANTGLDTTLLNNVNSLSHSVLDAAKSVTDIIVSDNPANTASLSVSLVNNANEIVSNILTLSGKQNALSTAVHDVTAKHLAPIEKIAINLANADNSSSDGKVAIALNSLTLIAQSNHLIEEVLKEAKLDNAKSAFAHNLTDLVLDTAKTITALASADTSKVDGKQQIASASTHLVGQINEIVKSITTITNSETKVGNAAYQSLKNHLDQVESIAMKLAAANASTAEGRTEIAIESFNLIAKTNGIMTDFLNQIGIKEELTKPIHGLSNSILDTAKTLTNVVQIDPTTDKGKLSIADSSFELAKSANQIVSYIMDLSGSSSELSHNIANTAHQILSISQDRLLSIGNSISALANADKLTKEGVKIIVDSSFAITSDVNGFVTDVVKAVGKDGNPKVGSALSLSNSIIDMGHSIANLIQSDVNTSSGKAAIAEGSIKLIGNINGLVSDVLSLSNASTAVSEAISSSAGGILTNLSSLIGSSIKLHNWSSMSQADQIAVGFDIGLKAVSTIATGVGTTAQSIAKIIGTTTMLPQIGAAVSGIALAASPLEIKGLVDEHKYVKQIDSLASETKTYGYQGDELLASLLNEKFALNTAYTATDIALNLATTAISVAATASVIGAPIAAIAGVVRGAIGGIMSAIKQPALEHIANRYVDQIEEYGDIQKYFDQNTEATLNKFYASQEVIQSFKQLQKLYNVDNIITLDGVSSSNSAIELAAITKLVEQMNKANNYAQLIRNGEIDKALSAQYLSMDAKTGVLEITAPGNSLIKFNSPLFAPGVEEARRKAVGKNNFYTDLIINGPNEHTINDGAGNNIFISNDKYASVLYDENGKLLKHINLNINAGDGNDTYIADNGHSLFNGGNGTDSVSYNNEHIHGIVVHGRDAGTYSVTKHIADAEVTVENIKVKNHQYGKRQERVEYRELHIETKSYDASDMLYNVEVISASDYDDVMYGSKGNDYFLAQNGNDLVYGKEGDDIIFGGAGDDKLYGETGNDTLNGGLGKDLIYGGEGNDTIIQDDALSSDTIFGDEGVDTLDLRHLVINDEGLGVVADLQSEKLYKGTIFDHIYDIENIIGTSGNDNLIGNHKDNILIGNDGDDILEGYSGNDVLAGGSGINKLYGGQGADIYLLSTNATNYIFDLTKNNLAKLENSEDLNLQFTKDSDDNVTLSFNKDGNTIGKTIIEKASQFGTFSIGDGYYLDLNDGKFKYILSGESSNADLAQNTLHFNKGEELQVHAAAKDNQIILDHEHQYYINIYSNTQTNIKGFEVGKDKLQLSLLSNNLSSDTTLRFSGYDVEGGDVNITSGNTYITLSGVGHTDYASKTFNELVTMYLV